MFKAVHAITAAVPFRATAAPPAFLSTAPCGATRTRARTPRFRPTGYASYRSTASRALSCAGMSRAPRQCSIPTRPYPP